MTSLTNIKEMDYSQLIKSADNDLKLKEAFDVVISNNCDFSKPEVNEAVSFMYAFTWNLIARLESSQRIKLNINDYKDHLIEDGFQNAWLKLIELFKKNNFRSHFGIVKWIATFTQNYIYTWYPKYGNNVKTGFYDRVYTLETSSFSSNEEGDIVIDPAQGKNANDRLFSNCSSDNPEDYHHAQFLNESINAVLASPKLNKIDKTILKLYFFGSKEVNGKLKQLTFDDVAERLSMNKQTVKTNYYRAMDKCASVCKAMGLDSSMLTRCYY